MRVDVLLGRAILWIRDGRALLRGRLLSRLWNRIVGRGLAAIGRRLWR
jgi:hypothetical protein